MANFKLEKIASARNKRFTGLASIQIRDLGRIKRLAGTLLVKVAKPLPDVDQDKIDLLDALFTTIFIRYRRCFDAANRGTALGLEDIPTEYVDIHSYVIDRANKVYAHAEEEMNEAAHQIDTATGAIVGMSTILTEDLHPVNAKGLIKLIELVDVLLKRIEVKKEKFMVANGRR